jgi:Dyp-type peroxidase family
MATVVSATPSTSADFVLNLDEIQGNILAGFNNDHQRFLFLSIDDAGKAKVWLNTMIPKVATSTVVKASKDQRKIDIAAGRTPANAKWMNIAFNYKGLDKLGASHLSKFPSEFKEGMASRAHHLGDVGLNAPDHWEQWLQCREFLDILVLLAADDPNDLDKLLNTIKHALPTSGLSLIHIEAGEAPPGDASANEHFGFRDGISQPGVKTFTTPITSDPTQGIPGQDLLWPGEFVLGYPTQVKDRPPAGVDPPNPKEGPISKNGPDWSKDGSFLVFRKLAQDVAGFRNSVRTNASLLGIDPEVLGAKLVGRFRSGCPMEALSNPLPGAPDTNDGDPSIANSAYLDQLHINDFEYGDDLTGKFTPRSGHVRKAYPRDEQFLNLNGTENTSGSLNESDTQTHRILRRGIPFGAYMRFPTEGLGGQFTDDGVARGLLFLCYQRSIEDQFEFILTRWVNRHNFPDAGDGVDPVMSQVKVAPMQCRFKGHATPTTFELKHFVTTNGGEYFFQPSISALKKLAS